VTLWLCHTVHLCEWCLSSNDMHFRTSYVCLDNATGFRSDIMTNAGVDHS